MATTLSASELLKYDWRVTTFLEKYKKKDKFELIGGQKVNLLYDQNTYNIIDKRKNGEIQKLEFSDSKTKSRKYKLTSFKKTIEFGGKPEGGAGVSIEMREINSINKQMDEIRSKTGKIYVPMEIGGKIYHAVMCHKTTGVPKSDFNITDEQGNQIIWISHKEGSKPNDFQQWGGMTEGPIQNHPEVQAFIKQMQQKFPDGIPNATTIAKPIKDEQLKKMAVYGINFTGRKTTPMGLQNVTIVLQGPVKVIKKGRNWTLTANHTHDNGERITGPFEPVLMCMYKGDRSNFGVAGARFGIQPRASRKVTEWLK